ncbi:Dynamin [Hyella patelloides LEGE 07179]|uniref:Dynamin n=1 Tax=Hyella patelloides LEGE 07179 TaxID=945734 RepID=A0A563VR54_9CYAN|nr:dynamin family protein [Hyella patelloides]VEP13747.1 Dynamin [Hyella patelloides LEGE 07179]
MTAVEHTEINYQSTFGGVQKAIISLVGDLKQLKKISRELNLDKSIPLIDDVIERVQNKSFSVAIVGEFKRGKSTFINALLGRDILPSDILPCSATLNRVTYGVTPAVKVIFKDGKEEEVAIDRLEDYVTKLTAESEDTAANVKEAIVSYPVHYCQNNVDIIDTPGLNDESNMDEVTLSVLPQVDAAIMVILAQSPFGESERRFLEDKLLSNDLGRIIFVVNGIDNFNRPGDADRVIGSIQNRIQKMVIDRAKEEYGENSPEYEVYIKKIGTPKVFGISAYQALESKQTGDAELLASSRFAEFEASLEKFLTEERGATFLQVPVNRVIASANEILKTLDIQENALGMKQQEFQSKYENSVAEITDLREKNAQEMNKIDAAAVEVKQRVRPLVTQFPEQLKQSAITAIDSAVIDLQELKNPRSASEKLGRLVSSAIQKSAQQQSEKIQKEIEIGLVKEVSRLENFANDVVGTLQNIEMQFVSIEASTKANTNATGEGITAALAVFTGFGGIWSGYQEAGVKGAAVGAAGSFGTFFAAGLVAGIIGLPFTFPVVIAVGALSVFTGRRLVQKVFGGEQIQNFKNNYKKAALTEIENRLGEARLEQNANQQINETFDKLKQTVRQEVDALLDNTQNTLTDISAKRERDEVMTEQEREDIQEMRKQTERILGSAQGLSRQLTQKINLAEKLAD